MSLHSPDLRDWSAIDAATFEREKQFRMPREGLIIGCLVGVHVDYFDGNYISADMQILELEEVRPSVMKISYRTKIDGQLVEDNDLIDQDSFLIDRHLGKLVQFGYITGSRPDEFDGQLEEFLARELNLVH